MRAIISDVHSNIEALEAVFKDIEEQGADDVACLGDIVGYGPDPEPCIDLIEEKCRFCISGNHDYAVLTRPERFNPLAVEAVNFTRRVLQPGIFSVGRKRARWNFLEEAPTRVAENGSLYVHGSPRDDRNEYILESDIAYGNIEKIEDIFNYVERLLFVGHTHWPGVIAQDITFWHPEDNGVEFELQEGRKYLINVGSVGQPRDGDNRACYLLQDDDKIIYRRVPYDFKKTVKKMARVGPISKDAGSRLELGH